MSVPAARSVATVRRAAGDDLPVTAAIHHRCLPDGLFARLGTAFLARYHATFRTGPVAMLLVAESDGEVVGFLAGTVDNAEHYRRLLRTGPVALLVSGLVALFRDRRLAVEFARTRTGRYARAVLRQLRSRDTSAATDEAPVRGGGPVAVLTHVAVTEAARGSGAGRELVERFVDELGGAGAAEVRLVTAAGGGGPGFYRSLGWSSRGTRRAADGSYVEEFVRTL